MSQWKTRFCFPPEKIIWLLVIIIYSVFVSLMGFYRYSLNQSSWDLGVFTQGFEGLYKLGFMYNSLDFFKNPSGNYLGVHFSPLLYLFFPFYYIWPSPITLIVVQTVFYSAGVIPLYLLAKRELGKLPSMLISIAHLVHPGSLYLLLYDFHEIAFFPTLFFLTIFFYRTNRTVLFFSSLLLSCLVNEFTPIVMIFFSLYCILYDRKLRVCQVPASIISLALATLISITSFYVSGAINPIWAPQHGWSILGTSLGDIFSNLLVRPDLVFLSLTNDIHAKVLNILYLLGPYLFLPVLSNGFLIVLLPWMGAVLLSSFPIYTIFLHYQAMNLPVSIVATIIGGRRFCRVMKISVEKMATTVLVMTLVFTIMIGPTGLLAAPSDFNSSQEIYGYRIDLTRNIKVDTYDQFVALVPDDSVVLTQVRFYPQLADKTPYVLLNIPPTDWPFYGQLPLKDKLSPEYVLLDLDEPSFLMGATYYWENGTTRYVTSLSSTYDILSDGDWGVFAEVDSVILYKRSYDKYPLLYDGFMRTYNSSNLIYDANKVQIHGYDQEEILEHAGNDSQAFWYGSYEYYPPGLYEATIFLRVKPGTSLDDNGSLLIIDVTTDQGKTILDSYEISSQEVSHNWSTFTLQFKVPLEPLSLEFRGLNPYPNLPIQLQKIVVERIDFP